MTHVARVGLQHDPSFAMLPTLLHCPHRRDLHLHRRRCTIQMLTLSLDLVGVQNSPCYARLSCNTAHIAKACVWWGVVARRIITLVNV